MRPARTPLLHRVHSSYYYDETIHARSTVELHSHPDLWTSGSATRIDDPAALSGVRGRITTTPDGAASSHRLDRAISQSLSPTVIQTYEPPEKDADIVSHPS